MIFLFQGVVRQTYLIATSLASHFYHMHDSWLDISFVIAVVKILVIFVFRNSRRTGHDCGKKSVLSSHCECILVRADTVTWNDQDFALSGSVL